MAPIIIPTTRHWGGFVGIKIKNFRHFIAFGFGSGLLPLIPGTWGTIAAIPIYLLLYKLPVLIYFLILLVSIVGGIWICDKTAKEFNISDPPFVNWDEVVGFLATMPLIPGTNLWVKIVIGFALFRLFDIWKPWPIRWMDQNIDNGVGIIIDDLAAAIYSGILSQIVFLFIKW